MPKNPTKLTGSAGEHYVAYKLSCLGIIVALTREGAPNIDILASNLDSSKIITIQVKTAAYAGRDRGKGENRKLHHLEFPLGHKSGKTKAKGLYFAFVDLNGLDWHEKDPDVYFMPSSVVFDFCAPWIDTVSMARFHVDPTFVAPYKNNWDYILNLFEVEKEE